MPSRSPNDKPRFNFRVSKSQYERINELAKAANKTASDYARQRTLTETDPDTKVHDLLIHRLESVEQGLVEVHRSLDRLLAGSNRNCELAAASIAAASLLRDSGQVGTEDKVADHIDVALSAAPHVMAIYNKNSAPG